MALQATPYKVSLDISNVDAGIYESVKATVARHPSETELRLTARILAFALFYHEHLKFGRGLSDTDEAALWQISLSDEIEHWIDVGQPDAERITKASRRAPRMTVLAYGNTRIWWEKTAPKVAPLRGVNVFALPEAPHSQLASGIDRSIHWGVMVSDGVVYISDGDTQVELPLEGLQRSGG